MAHEISIQNGKAETFFGMTPAWHGLGTVLDHFPTSEEAINAAHLDWEIKKIPLVTETGIKVPEHFATVRSDTGDVLGVVSDRYKIVQNRQAFAFLDGLLQDGAIRYESAGALRGGRTVWLLARMPSIDEIAPGDTTRRYVLFSTSHDGTASIQAIPTSVRVVCANTLRIATTGSAGFRHTGDVKSKMTQAQRYLSQFDSQFTLFRDNARLLADKKHTADEAKEYIEALFPEVDEAGRSRSIRERKVQNVRNNFRNSRQRIPSIAGSWWSLFNAVSESVDHDPRKRRGNREQAENRMLTTMYGHGADFKDKAFRLALTMAG